MDLEWFHNNRIVPILPCSTLTSPNDLTPGAQHYRHHLLAAKPNQLIRQGAFAPDDQLQAIQFLQEEHRQRVVATIETLTPHLPNQMIAEVVKDIA